MVGETTPVEEQSSVAAVGSGVGQQTEMRGCKPVSSTDRALGPNHGPRASSVRAELVGCQAEKCLLLPGDDISPNKLTMPPVAIECVRNIRREALASFWEACHVANNMSPNQIIYRFWGLLRISFVRSIQPWKQTKTGTEVPSLTFLRRILQPHPHVPHVQDRPRHQPHRSEERKF